MSFDFAAKGEFAKTRNVGDFVAAKALLSSKVNQDSERSRNENITNHLESPNFRRFQQSLESGSGPVGWRFKSSLPDQFSQALKQHFWFSIYINVSKLYDHVFQYKSDG
jgi:hypothetical protein